MLRHFLNRVTFTLPGTADAPDPPPPPPPPPPAPKPAKAPEPKQARRDERDRAKRRRGQASTVKTGSQGVLTEGARTTGTLLEN